MASRWPAHNPKELLPRAHSCHWQHHNRLLGRGGIYKCGALGESAAGCHDPPLMKKRQQLTRAATLLGPRGGGGPNNGACIAFTAVCGSVPALWCRGVLGCLQRQDRTYWA